MSPLAGIVFSGALLLLVAGAAKLVRPDATRVALRTAGLPSTGAVVRLLGAVEVIAAVVTFVASGALGAVLVAVSYAGFAAFSALLLRRSRGRASCGCFGGDDAPVTKVHVWLNVAVAVAVALTLTNPAPSFLDAMGDTPAAGIPFAALVLLLAWLLFVAYTVLPAVQAAARPIPSPAPGTAGTGPGQGLSISPRPEVAS